MRRSATRKPMEKRAAIREAVRIFFGFWLGRTERSPHVTRMEKNSGGFGGIAEGVAWKEFASNVSILTQCAKWL